MALPVVVQLLRLASEGRESHLSSLKEVICSGAPLGKKHLDRFRKRFPNITLSQVSVYARRIIHMVGSTKQNK